MLSLKRENPTSQGSFHESKRQNQEKKEKKMKKNEAKKVKYQPSWSKK